MREFDVLQKFDFTSERQRSSIIVRDLSSNKIMIYVKGSDKKIFAGKGKFSADNIYEISQKHVDQFARQGLRTLCYSFKYLDENEYNNWVKEYDDLKYQAINNKNLNSQLDQMIEKLEGDSIILGVTALEDKLQDRVKEDIEDFIDAGINFWMITGDKMDTAETIGYSCGIISEDNDVYKIRENKDVEQVIKEMEDIKQKISKVDEELEQITEQHQQKLEKIRTLTKSTDLLYVLFTSGSTGVPKGVTISHAAVIDFMDWVCERYSLDETTVLCNQAPFYFDASVPDVFIPLKTGATVYIPPKMYYTFPKKILQYIADNSINTLVWVPSALCNVVNCKAFDVVAPQSIRLVIFCGEVMPCKHLNVWRKYIPEALYVNMYGPTEATYACMYYDIDREFDDDAKLPLGKACENSEIILITDDDREADDGEIGEICILGQCLANGYYNNQEKTSEVFVQNPLNKKWIELMYRTGDLAYKNNGEIVFAGRKDYQIKRLGHRIELGEIENAIMSIDAVEVACCVYDSVQSDIIAIYTGKIERGEVSRLVEEKLPNYMLPTRYEHLTTMPMNLNGKIDRAMLNKKYAEEL